jgi:hypothetical protein
MSEMGSKSPRLSLSISDRKFFEIGTSDQAVIQASKPELRIVRYELTGHYRR